VRTAAEIGRERYALKALRDDFRNLKSAVEPARPIAALRAVNP